MDPEVNRSVIIAGSVGVGVLVLVGVAIAVSTGGGGDKTTSVQVEQPSTTISSSTTRPLNTTTSTPTTLAPGVIPPVVPKTSPPTVVIIPPTTPATPAPAPAPTSPTSTSRPVTTSTTRPVKVVELETKLEIALNGGSAPAPGTLPRVHVVEQPGVRTEVTWALDPLLSTAEQKVAAREEAFELLKALQAAHLAGRDPIVLRATLPDPATGQATRVIRATYTRATLDAIDFPTANPQRILLRADSRVLDPTLRVPTTTTTTAAPATTTTT